MSLNVEGGLSRLVRGLRILANWWWWTMFVGTGLVLAVFAGGDAMTTDTYLGLVLALLWAAVPAGVMRGIAWLLAGFLEPK